MITNRVLFTTPDREIWHRLGLVSNLCGPYFNSFHTTNRHSINGYSIHMSSFNPFLSSGLPWRNDLIYIIHHYYLKVHCICSKAGTEIFFNESIMCARFQFDWSMYVFMFYGLFCEACKNTKKETFEILVAHTISWKWLGRFFFQVWV